MDSETARDPLLELALHVLEVMHAVHVASDEGRHVELTTTCERPAALLADLPDGVLRIKLAAFHTGEL